VLFRKIKKAPKAPKQLLPFFLRGYFIKTTSIISIEVNYIKILTKDQ
jgi:hypothetical protein